MTHSVHLSSYPPPSFARFSFHFSATNSIGSVETTLSRLATRVRQTILALRLVDIAEEEERDEEQGGGGGGQDNGGRGGQDVVVPVNGEAKKVSSETRQV